MKIVTVLALLLSILPAGLLGWLSGLWASALAAGAVWFVLLLPLIAAVRIGVERIASLAAGLFGR